MRRMWWLAVVLWACAPDDPETGPGPGPGPGPDPDPEPDCGAPNATAFSVGVYEVDVPARASDGTAWDLDGSYADPFACIGTEDEYWGCTETDNNTTHAGLYGWAGGVALEGAVIDVWDEDLSDHDWIGGVWLSLDFLREAAGCGTYEVGGADYGFDRLTFDVERI